MASVNKVILVGNLGRDPELKYMPDGQPVANIALATTDKWTDKPSGDAREKTEWHRVVFYRKLAEIVGKHLIKGSSIYVEGRLQTRKWTDKDGIERFTTEIVADNMQMLGVKPGAAADQDSQPAGKKGGNKPAGKRGNQKPAPDNDLESPPF